MHLLLRNQIVKSLILLVSLPLAFMLLAGGASAHLRDYQVSVENSSWQMTKQTRLECELSHEIPYYGVAQFVSEASKQLNMSFNLDMLRLPSRYDSATVYSKPPKWMPGAISRRIAEMRLLRQYDGDLPEAPAWEMLVELEKGYHPTLFYQDWRNPSDQVAVGLNASKFIPAYQAFSVCIDNLLPFGFEDIAYTVLTYQVNKPELTRYSKKRLEMIGDYLKEDIDLELVLIAGHTDTRGDDWANEQLSLRRANELRDYFASMGIDLQRIEVSGLGEKRNISPNETAIDRAKNKRVVIRMQKL
ncbi:MAG: OmpA family protein [Pseudomonadota bacterium]